MALATLSIDLEARLARFEEGMNRAARIAEKQAAAVQAAWDKSAKALGTVLAGAGGALAGYSLVEALRQNVDFLDSLNDMADATGSTIGKLSGLVDVAERTGTSAQVAEAAVVKLNAALNDTDPDSTASRALKAIGLSADELRKSDPVDALAKVAQALAQYQDDGSKARLVQELLGKSARELAPLLKDLGEAGEVNAKITKEQAEEAERFNKQLSALRATIADTARTLTSSLLPAVNSTLEALRQGDIGKLLGLDSLDARVQQLIATYRLVGLARDRVRPLSILEGDPNNAGALAELARIDAQAKGLAESLQAARRALLGIGTSQAGAGRGFINPPLALPSVGQLPAKSSAAPKEKIDESTKALMHYIDQLGKQLVKVQDLSAAEEAVIELQKLGWNGAEQGSAAVVLQLAREIDMRKRGAEFAKAMTAEMERQAKELSGLDEELMKFAGRIEDARKQALTARLEARLAMGETFSPDELEKIVKGIAGVTEAAQEKMNEFAAQAARNIQDTLGETVLRTMKGDFDGILDLWADTVNRMVAQALAAKLGNALLGDDFAKTGNLGGLAKQGLDWLMAALPGFADGGDHMGGLRIVGERGPELQATGPARIFNADQTRRIFQPAMQGGGGGLTVYQTFHLASPADPRTQQQAAAAAARGLDTARRRNS